MNNLLQVILTEEVPFDWVGVLNFDTVGERVVLGDNEDIVSVYTVGDNKRDGINEFNWDDVDDRKFIKDAVAVIDVVDDLTAYLVIHDIEEDKINAVFVIGVFE